MARPKTRESVPVEVVAVAGTGRPSEPSISSPGEIPSVDAMVTEIGTSGTAGSVSTPALTAIVRGVLAEVREQVLAGITLSGDSHPRARIDRILSELSRTRTVPVINATGIIIHTNLGRAPVSVETARAMAAAAAGAVALEIDPVTNRRGGRMDEISRLVRALTGAEATIVVNNNAAAVLLVLASLGQQAEIVLSRGESVEIGGGFRIPDVLRQSGGELVEVGTTNRTYARDYSNAITPRTAALVKIHPSNFRMSGFVHETSLAEVAGVGRETGVPVIYDQGNGLLIDGTRFGLPSELSIGDAIAAGADVVTASGDKLLGGPQAGLICGSPRVIERISAHPWARAVRADKSCLAGVVATLRHYLAGEELSGVPVWRMLSASTKELGRRADALLDVLGAHGVPVGRGESDATPGGGSYPDVAIPSIVLTLTPSSGADALAQALRTGSPGVFGRIEDGQVLLDLRSVLPEDDGTLAGAIVAAMGAVSPHQRAT